MDSQNRLHADTFYFAYGSNMDREQMAKRCQTARLIGTAVLSGHRFIINSRGVATIVPDQGSVVHGVVWSLSREDEARLDVYEGVAKGLYRKEWIQIVLADGDKPEALVYVAADSSKGNIWGEYLNRIIKAAKLHGLPPEYVRELEGWTRMKRIYTHKEEEYLARLMSGGMDRTRAEWYLNSMQTWTHEDYIEYARAHLEMLDAPDEYYP